VGDVASTRELQEAVTKLDSSVERISFTMNGGEIRALERHHYKGRFKDADSVAGFKEIGVRAAFVDKYARLDRNAMVLNGGRVMNHGSVIGNAIIDGGIVCDHGFVAGNAIVERFGKVSGYGMACGNSRIEKGNVGGKSFYERTKVFGDVVVKRDIGAFMDFESNEELQNPLETWRSRMGLKRG
jgi:hypothetical protein